MSFVSNSVRRTRDSFKPDSPSIGLVARGTSSTASRGSTPLSYTADNHHYHHHGGSSSSSHNGDDDDDDDEGRMSHTTGHFHQGSGTAFGSVGSVAVIGSRRGGGCFRLLAKVATADVPIATLFALMSYFLFTVGAFFFLHPELDKVGACIFATGCLVGCCSCFFVALHVWHSREHLIFYLSPASNFMGNITFATFSFTYCADHLQDMSLWGFLVGTIFFWTASWMDLFLLIRHTRLASNPSRAMLKGLYGVVVQCFWGTTAFMVGSIFLFFDKLALAGSWLYAAGSIIFFVAAARDLFEWFDAKRHATQQAATSCFIADIERSPCTATTPSILSPQPPTATRSAKSSRRSSAGGTAMHELSPAVSLPATSPTSKMLPRLPSWFSTTTTTTTTTTTSLSIHAHQQQLTTAPPSGSALLSSSNAAPRALLISNGETGNPKAKVMMTAPNSAGTTDFLSGTSMVMPSSTSTTPPNAFYGTDRGATKTTRSASNIFLVDGGSNGMSPSSSTLGAIRNALGGVFHQGSATASQKSLGDTIVKPRTLSSHSTNKQLGQRL